MDITSSLPTSSDLYDNADTGTRVAYVRSVAAQPAETVNPVAVMGQDRWNELVAQDPTGGAAALAQFQRSWAWTPEDQRRQLVTRRFAEERLGEIAGADVVAGQREQMASMVASLVHGDPAKVAAAEQVVSSGSPADIINFRHASLFGV